MLGIVGTKVGMTRVFKDDGKSIPVTVVQVSKSKIVQRKTQEKDGYFGIQVNYCLLYTSPSPRDRQKSRMPSSA